MPWQEAQYFAKQAVTVYQNWHREQSAMLKTYLPKWEQELARLRTLPQFLPHSMMTGWVDGVNSQFLEMNMSISEAMRTMPNRIQKLLPC
ncbi:DNA helicase IV [Vibrio maritimus]|uniref:DNA helicase IV n=1 Tax=Vibrio maritimus TaxID=990268 RepID=A0A090SWW2_9VIBR|nr:DNA helicase IV [Vibrio maritimus]